MKKMLVALGVILALAGCGSQQKDFTEYETPAAFIDIEATFDSEWEKATFCQNYQADTGYEPLMAYFEMATEIGNKEHKSLSLRMLDDWALTNCPRR